MRNAQNLERELRKEIRKNMHVKAIVDIFRLRGWHVVYFDNDQNEDLIKRFKVNKMAKTNRAFTLPYQNTYVIFIRDDLPNKDIIKLLLHEAGHIIYGHNFKNISTDDEIEANKFMTSCINEKSPMQIIAYIAIVLLIISISFNIFITRHLANTNINASPLLLSEPGSNVNIAHTSTDIEETVFITEYGDKYHTADCTYIQGKENLVEVTSEEAMQLGKQACKYCKP